MEIIIHDSHKLTEIQETFNTHFPYLRLEFFDYGASTGMGSVEKQKALWNITLADIRNKTKNSHLCFNSHEKISIFKKYCLDEFGIQVQVFRKAGNSWIQIPTDDELTFSEQNKLGQKQAYNWQAITENDSIHINRNLTNS